MDNGQPTNGQQQKRNSRATNYFAPPLLNGAGSTATSNIWSSNPMRDGLGPRENTGVNGAYDGWGSEGAKLTQSTAPGQSLHSAQRSTGISGSDPWATWKSPDNSQSRPNPSRSTSPPSAFQNTSNTSPSFNPGRLTNGQSNTFPTSLTNPSSGLTSRASISGASQPPRVNSFQSPFGAFTRTNSGTSAFDDGATPRESGLPPSRHSEISEATLQYNNDASRYPQGYPSHARHASRPSISGASTSFYQTQQPNSRSQSLAAFDEPGLDAARRSLAMNMPSNSPAPQFNTVQTSTPASLQSFRWVELPPGNAVSQNYPYGQEGRRESLAMSVNQSATNSPRAFASIRPADQWASPAPAVDGDYQPRVSRSQSQIPRQPNPYTESPYAQVNQAALDPQVMQQLMFNNPYAMAGQQYYSTAPAAYGSRSVRNMNAYENYKATPALLEDFKKTSKGANRKWQLRDIFGYVVDFAGDQQGSRFLQEKIPSANSDDKAKVFDEIIENANQMMTDVFGNYIIQKLFEYGTLSQKRALAHKMSGNVVDLSMNIYGCRCVQEAFHYVLVEQQVELAMELKADILDLMKGVHSNHVVQKMLQKVPRDRIDFVYDAVRGKVYDLSKQQYGCRVIQRMIELGSEKDKEFILAEFHQVAHKLVTDDWGNYVVQAVIKQGEDKARSEVIQLCIDQFLVFSKQKVASNVMEHCIEYGKPADRLKIYNLIMNSRTEDGSGLLQAMWKDQFANYVVQKLCFHLKGVEQETLIRESRPYYMARKKPSRPDEKWAAFENLMSHFRATVSRQGSVSSTNGDLNGVNASRPSSQGDMNSAMPTPALTTGGNSPRTSSSQATNDGPADIDTPRPLQDLINKLDETNLRDKAQA